MMDISNIETVLINSKIRYKILSAGIDVKLGFFLGSFFVKYDQVNDSLIYGSKFRWLAYVFSLICFIYIITTNFNNHTVVFIWLVSLIYTVVTTLLKERKILSIKKSVYENALLTSY